MHEVMTKFWRPNKFDLRNGITSGFGATIDIINSSSCGLYEPSLDAIRREKYFKSFWNYFGLTFQPRNTACENMVAWSQLGNAVVPMYLE